MSKNKVLGPPVSYVDLLDHETYEASKANEERVKEEGSPYNPLRPSSSGRCTRELAYGLMEYTRQEYYPKEPKEPNVTRLLSIGHSIEWNLIKQLKQYIPMHFDVKYEQQSVYGFNVTSEKYPELNKLIEGSLDLCFWSPEHKCLADIKSKKDKFHRFFKTDWDNLTDKLMNMETVEPIGSSTQGFWIKDLIPFLEELNDPFFAANFWQLNFYANTDWAKVKEIDHAAIIQYNKNDSRLREIRFKPCTKLYEKTKEKFQRAADAASSGDPEEAPRDFMFGSIKCAFCDYNKRCWGSKIKESGIDPLKAFFQENFPNKKWPKDSAKFGKKKKEALEAAYADVLAAEEQNQKSKRSEEIILEAMLEAKTRKIRFEDGRVYEAKYLKSPSPHYELRRSKA